MCHFQQQFVQLVRMPSELKNTLKISKGIQNYENSALSVLTVLDV